MRVAFFIFFLSVIGTDAYSQPTLEITAPPEKQRPYSENDTIPKVFYSNDDDQSAAPLVQLNGQYASTAVLKAIRRDKIEDVEIEKGIFKINDKEYHGKILITTKPGYHPKLLTIIPPD